MNSRAAVRVVTLDEPLATDPKAVGRKAATLARLAGRGYPVPVGVVRCVSPAPGDADNVVDLAAAVLSACGDGPYAVRSSSPLEDGEISSAAGRFRTELDVRSDALADAVRRVIESAGDAPMAVLVQPMVDAAVAGVAFGADPVTGDRDTVVLSAVRGLAESLVSGEADAEQWAVRDGSPTRTRRLSDGDVLTEPQVREITALVQRVGSEEGRPQDVEWAIDGAGLHLLQARPITALPQPPDLDLPPGTWLFDRHHYPEGMTAFGASIAAPAVAAGLTDAFARCGSLIGDVSTRAVAGRPYLRMTPLGGRGGPPPPAAVLGILVRVVPTLRRRVRRARELLESGELAEDLREWETTGRSAARHATAELAAVAVADLDDAALADHLEDAHRLLRRGLDSHFHLMPAHLVGVCRLLECGRSLLGWPDAVTMELLTGLSPASSAPAADLAALARDIAADPGAAEVFASLVDGADGGIGTDGATGDDEILLARLAARAPGIAARLDEWQQTYGLRTVNDDPGSPTIREVPGLVPGLLVEQLRAMKEGAPEALSPGVAASPDGPASSVAAARLDQARQILKHRAPRDAEAFEKALSFARSAYPVREDNVLWALAMPAGLLRRAAMEIGARLSRRCEIAAARDIVMLPLPTVLAAARGETPPGALRPLVAQARAERAWAATHPLPGVIGPPPSAPPDLRFLPRTARMLNAALALNAPATGPQTPAPAGVLLAGTAGSPGRHTGRVRIVRGPDDFTALRRGEVMVCGTTDPSWSVLFAVAGAVVADGGTLLAHAAIIAREHGIPAVLGTGCATTTLADGQLVSVDGTAGVVHAAHP